MSHGIRNHYNRYHTQPRWYVEHMRESRRITATRLALPLVVVAYLSTTAAYVAPQVFHFFQAIASAIH